MRILLVEDDARVAEVIAAALRGASHVVRPAASRREAEQAVHDETFDLVLLDIGLPDGSGIEVCRRLREGGSSTPVLVLTARNQLNDRVDGLDAGADDYLGKPFAMAELLARVRALGRRGPRWTDSVRRWGAVTIDRDRRMLRVSDAPVPLTARELEIAMLLAWREGRVVPRDELLEAVWGDSTESAASSLEVLVARIRRKVGERARVDVIRTVRQVGYAWALDRSRVDSAGES
jgi:two-component system OmpR family response regulator